MTVFRVQSHNGEIYNPEAPRRDVMGLLAKQIEQYARPPRVSIQLPAHHQSTPFALQPKDKNTLVVDFRWLGYVTGLRALPDMRAPYDKAGKEADGLAYLINQLRVISPDSPVDVVAHRLGARVAIMAVRKARSKMWRRLLLSNALEFSARTLMAFDCPMGAHLKCYNIVAKDHSLTPFLFDRFGPKPGPADRPICYGYQFARTNWREVPEHSREATGLMLEMGANTLDFTRRSKQMVFQSLYCSLRKTLNFQ
jgi:pimeloyl-ACP methyl ester carboxylesterase